LLSRRDSSTLAAPADVFPYLQESALVLAISGGSDSTALLMLAAEARRKSASPCRLVAVTVDHALRAESADEARAVAALAAKLGVEHRTMIWQGAKPVRGVQAAAREARQALLAEAAEHAGARVILTGHTLDDQAETVLMRAARGDGIGLAGIAPATLYRGKTWFARPLLTQRRQALREMLATRGIGWIDDPSNENADFERVRVRKQLAGDTDMFEKTIARARDAIAKREALGKAVAQQIGDFARLAEASSIQVDAKLLDAGDVALHALRLLIATAGGAAHLPDRDRSAVLVEALCAGDVHGSLANALVRRNGGTLFLTRDRRGRAGPGAPLSSPYAELLPSFDHAAAGAIARLLGQPPLPAMPGT
jgi:tRNA(Ile)-lysidine synthase